jgi:hypothetical protein
MKHPGKTPPFRGPNREILPSSIAEITYLRLGGLDQWVMIRGESVANPLLILLHGGPGFPEMRLFRTFNAPLEQSSPSCIGCSAARASHSTGTCPPLA